VYPLFPPAAPSASVGTPLLGNLRTGIVVVSLFVGFSLSVMLLDELEWAAGDKRKTDLLLMLQIATAMSLPAVGLFQTKVCTPTVHAIHL
jgi:hypothetical protein